MVRNHLNSGVKGLMLVSASQHALAAIIHVDVTGCFGKQVLLEPTPLRVADRCPCGAVGAAVRLGRWFGKLIANFRSQVLPARRWCKRHTLIG